jgi:hypothetical protein
MSGTSSYTWTNNKLYKKTIHWTTKYAMDGSTYSVGRKGSEGSNLDIDGDDGT